MEIATAAGVHRDTARRWKRHGRLPPGMHRLLEITLHGELGAIARAFAGWRLDARRGELVSPEGWCFGAGEIRAIPFRYGQIRELDRQVRQLTATIDSRADRRARVEALAELGQAIARGERALAILRADLTDRERDRLFELSPSREKIDAGDAPPGAPSPPASTGRDGA